MNKKLNELSLKKNSTRSSWQLELSSFSLLDEPEVSLSPQNQVKLAEEINKMARYLDIQFIIATHSPFMLGILNAKIYNLDTQDYKVQKWSELENVRYFYDFFKSRKNEFEKWDRRIDMEVETYGFWRWWVYQKRIVRWFVIWSIWRTNKGTNIITIDKWI